MLYSDLISGYLAGTLSEKEKVVLSKWLEQDPHNRELFDRLTNIQNIKEDISVAQQFNEEKAYASVRRSISYHQQFSDRKDSVHDNGNWWDNIFRNINMTTLSVGIAALLILISFTWLYLDEESPEKDQDLVALMQDVGAAKTGATLTLPDGRKIILDDVSDGKLLQEQGISISKTVDGQLIYEIQQQENVLENDTSINILSTARGETYTVKLPDGSIVNLNSATTLEYPMNFLHTSKRRIKLSGEAYFQVANRKDKPFVVEYKNHKAEVLGTAFNINAYDNENEVVTVLVNGSLRVSDKYDQSVLLRPSMAAFLYGKTLKSLAVDISQYTAWREGKFHFNNTSFDAVARQFSRWYDIDVEYVNGKVPTTKFSGEMSRNVTLKTVLSYFKELGIKFKLENRKLIVE